MLAMLRPLLPPSHLPEVPWGHQPPAVLGAGGALGDVGGEKAASLSERDLREAGLIKGR